MSEVCSDNRFDLIGEFKDKLVKGTNIETSPEEMAVLDNILFRIWQMGWLDKLKSQEPVAPVQQPDEEYICGACGNGVVGCDVFDEAGIESVKNDYCPTCGRRVKW